MIDFFTQLKIHFLGFVGYWRRKCPGIPESPFDPLAAFLMGFVALLALIDLVTQRLGRIRNQISPTQLGILKKIDHPFSDYFNFAHV